MDWPIPGKSTYAKLSLKIRNSNNCRRLPKISPFPVFRRSVGFFRCFVVIFPPFQHRQTRAKANKYKTCQQKNMLSAIYNSWKAIILHTLEDYIHGKPNDVIPYFTRKRLYKPSKLEDCHWVFIGFTRVYHISRWKVRSNQLLVHILQTHKGYAPLVDTCCLQPKEVHRVDNLAPWEIYVPVGLMEDVLEHMLLPCHAES